MQIARVKPSNTRCSAVVFILMFPSSVRRCAVARARRAAWRREARLSFSFPLVRDDAGGFGNAYLADKRPTSWGRDHPAVARRRFVAEAAFLLRRLALHCCALRCFMLSVAV